MLRLWLGELQSVDGYMNIALEKTEEFVDGKLRRSYGDAFVRGNNGSMATTFSASTLCRWMKLTGSALQLCTSHLTHDGGKM